MRRKPVAAASTFLDSLVASEFEIEIDGKVLNGIFRISGFVSYSVDETGTRKLPPFEIAKMVQHDSRNPFNTWLRETTAARHGGARPRRDVVIKAVDDGLVTRVWTVKNAYILSVRYSDFNVASFEMVEEIYTIAYDDIEEVFTLNE
jgi:hypothetical protein